MSKKTLIIFILIVTFISCDKSTMEIDEEGNSKTTVVEITSGHLINSLEKPKPKFNTDSTAFFFVGKVNPPEGDKLTISFSHSIDTAKSAPDIWKDYGDVFFTGVKMKKKVYEWESFPTVYHYNIKIDPKSNPDIFNNKNRTFKNIGSPDMKNLDFSFNVNLKDMYYNDLKSFIKYKENPKGLLISYNTKLIKDLTRIIIMGSYSVGQSGRGKFYRLRLDKDSYNYFISEATLNVAKSSLLKAMQTLFDDPTIKLEELTFQIITEISIYHDIKQVYDKQNKKYDFIVLSGKSSYINIQ